MVVLFKIFSSFFFIYNVFAAVKYISYPQGVEIIPDQFIITIKPLRRIFDLDLDLIRFPRKIQTIRFFRHLNMYVVRIHPREIKWLMRRPEIESIEADHIVFLNEVQNPAPWGISRLTSKEPINLFNSRYLYNPRGGEGVTVYILDSGIDVTHPEFEGRARWGKSFISDSNIDDNGHGTHVAGIVGSKNYGVAKSVKLVAVKAFTKSGTGSNSNIIAGIDWIARDTRRNNNVKKTVINMSFGTSYSNSLNRAVEQLMKFGISVVVASGNQNKDACLQSPAMLPNAITVGATNRFDERAKFSNFGSCVDTFAPGERIVATWPGRSTNSLSGTSMAAPHVSGLAAIFRSLESLSVSEIHNLIKEFSDQNVVYDIGEGSPNRLAHTDGR